MATASDTKRVLWQNVLALMRKHYGRENLSRFARETKCGPGTATRIKEQQTSVGTDTLEKIATAYAVEPWQLLVPNVDWDNPPALRPITAEERELYRRLLADARRITS